MEYPVKDRIEREADGICVECWMNGWPRRIAIHRMSDADTMYEKLGTLELEEAQGLYYALGRVLEEQEYRDKREG